MAQDNPYLKLVQDDLTGAVKSTMQTVADRDPDAEARLMKLAESAGVPLEAARLDTRTVERQVALDAIDYETLAKKYPSTAQLLADPSRAALAKDDVPELSALEDTLNLGVNFGRSLATGLIPKANAGLWGVAQAGSDVAAGALDPLVGTILPQNPFAVASHKFAGFRKEQNAVADAWRGKQEGMGFVQKSVLSGAESLGLNLMMTPASVLSGSPAPMLVGMTSVTGGDAYGQARDKNVPVAGSLAFASSQALVEYATEKMPIGALLKDLALKTSFKKLMVNQLWKEGWTEQVATGLQDLNEWAVLNPNSPFSDYINERPNAALQTLIATAVSTGGQVTIAKAADKLANGSRQQRTVDILTALKEGTLNSKTFERAPEQVKAFIKKHTENGPIENIFIPAEQYQAYFQNMQIDPAIAAAEMGAKNYAEAVVSGGDIVIPISDFIASTAKTPHYDALVPDIRFAQGEMTQREADLYEKNHPDEFRKLIEDAKNQQLPDLDAQSPAIQIETDIAGQLVAGGMEQATASNYAKTYANVMRNLAERSGMDPLALHEQYGLKITRPMADVLTRLGDSDIQIDPLLDRLRSGDIPTDLQINGPALTDFLREIGGINDAGGELNRMEVDEKLAPFMRNLRQLDGKGVDEAAALAREAGYPVDDILQAIEAEMQGNPVYSANNANEQLLGLRRDLDNLGEYLASLGIDLNNVTNAQVREAMAAAIGDIYNQVNMPATILVDGIERPTMNSEGKPIAYLTPNLENFWRWFADSRVVDEQGRPLVVYHGTPNGDFNSFDLAKAGKNLDSGFMGTGVYLTDSEQTAGYYSRSGAEIAPKIFNLYAGIKNPYLWGDKTQGVRGEVLSGKGIPSELREEVYARAGFEFDQNAEPDFSMEQSLSQSLREVLIERGHDGVIATFPSGGHEIVAFDPTQIKSIDNQGTYNPNSANIFFQGGQHAANRSKLQADENLLTISGGTARSGWIGATGIRGIDGQPAPVYRGAAIELEPDHFSVGSLGQATGHPSSGLGVWFSLSQDQAAQYGDVEEFRLDIRNPKEFSIEDFPAFDSVQDAHAFARRLQAEGFDGIVVDARGVGGPVNAVAFDPDQVILPGSGTQVDDTTTLFQSAPDYALKLDAPLSQQNDAVRRSLSKEVKRLRAEASQRNEPGAESIDDRITGQQLIDRITERLGSEDDAKSYLAALGVATDDMSMLFQSAAPTVTKEDVSAFADKVKDDLGLKVFDIHLRGTDLKLSTIIVPPDSQKQGKGTQALERLVAFADRNGLRVTLTAAVKDDFHGTTSHSRLVKFYKRFGFRENKGRYKDFAISEGMYRDPVKTRMYQSTNTDAFRAWAGTDRDVIESDEINDFDFNGDGPFVMRAYHGTTNTFDVFDASIKGNMEGQFGAVNYFTSSESDARDNYAGEGPDLTNRIDQRAERLADEITDRYQEFDNDADGVAAIKEQYGEDVYNEDMMEMARNIVRKELHGGDEIVMEVFVKTEKPFVVGESSPWFQFFDNDELDALAVARVADNEGLSVEEVEESRDDYEDQINDARYELMDEQENPLIAAVQTVANRYDFDPSDLFGSLYEITSEGEVRHQAIEELLRSNESLSYAENPEDGGIIQSQMIGEIIQEMGFDAIVLKDANARFKNMNMEHGIAHIHVFDANNTNIKSATDNDGTFDRDDPSILSQGTGDKRGYIQFGKDRKFNIALLENADLSTFIHETGHFYLEVIGDLASDPNASDALKADYASILKFLKVESRDQIGVEQHELFARANEAYLREGKAPSPELRGVFQKFKAWLTMIYKTAEALNVQLTDEVRGVFDRIYASEAEIEAAKSEMEVSGLFATAKEAGMTDAEFAAYRGSVEAATERAKDTLRARLMKQFAREKMAWWNQALDKFREEVAAEVDAQPQYRAFDALTKGELPDGTPFKLDKQNLVEQFGKQYVKRLPRGYGEGRGAVFSTGKNGLHHDAAADLLGYGSGSELVEALVNLRPRKALIEAEAKKRAIEAHGDILTDGSIADEAIDSMHNEERANILRTEMQALNRELSKDILPPVTVFRDAARGMIGQQQVRDIRPYSYLLAEKKASREAFAAMGEGRRMDAFQAKKRELLNHYLYKEATAALETVDEIYTYARKFTKTKTRAKFGKAGGPYLEQIDDLLEQYEFADVPKGNLVRRDNLLQFIKDRLEDDEPVMIPDAVLLDAQQRNYKTLPFDQLQAVRDAIKNIEHLVNLKTRLLSVQAQRQLEDVVAEGAASIAEFGTKQEPPVGTKTWLDSAKELRDGYFASHRKLSSMFREMDGWHDDGFMWNTFMVPINEAANQKAVRTEDATKKLTALFNKLQKPGLVNKAKGLGLLSKTLYPSLGRSLSKSDILALALNYGNEGNRQRIRDGYGWTDQQVLAALNKLEAHEWDFVQGMWDLIDSYWPEIAAQDKRVNGIAPAKVERSGFILPNGRTIEGGYYPIKYDERHSVRSYTDRAKEEADRILKGAVARPGVDTGFTKDRAGKVIDRKIKLDLGVGLAHIDTVLQTLTHREMLIDINKILGSSKMNGAILDHYGIDVYKAIQEGIVDIAAGEIGARDAFESGMAWLRSGVTIVGMGLNLTTAMMQPLGITQSMVRIGPKWAAKGVTRFIGDALHMENSAKFVYEKSPMMRLRSKTQTREIAEIRNKISKGGVMLKVEETYFYMIVKLQAAVDIPTWLGAYEKFMHETNNDEAKAIQLADQAVVDAQGGGQTKDLAAIQRGGPLKKLFTTFYSYFSATWNLTVESSGRTDFKKIGDIGKFAVDMLLLYTLPIVLVGMLREITKGNGGPDDDEEWYAWLAKEHLSFMSGTLVGVREFGSAFGGMFGYTGPAGTRFFSDASKLITQVGQGEVDEALVKAANNTMGMVFHYPAGQLQRTVDGFLALKDGSTSNPMVLLFGPPVED